MCVPFFPSAGPRRRHQAQSAHTHNTHIHTHTHTHMHTQIQTLSATLTKCYTHVCTVFFLLQAPDAGTKRKAHTHIHIHTHMHIHTYTHECRHCLQRKLHTTLMLHHLFPSAGPRRRHQAQSTHTYAHTHIRTQMQTLSAT